MRSERHVAQLEVSQCQQEPIELLVLKQEVSEAKRIQSTASKVSETYMSFFFLQDSKKQPSSKMLQVVGLLFND